MKYQIAEWFGEPFMDLPATRRQELADAALQRAPRPLCPFQAGNPPCSKKGGVCSIQEGGNHPAITCPKRFEESGVLLSWLARIAGFKQIHLAAEVPFMLSESTSREAGRIDLVIAGDNAAGDWLGLEIQAVYFSGKGMTPDFELLRENADDMPPEPTARRRPDWRSSSAKRLMPQLQIKAPTLRRWGKKLAVAVDLPFYEAIGGPTDAHSQDLNDGDIIWLVAAMSGDYQLVEHHWEVLSLEQSSDKLLSAATVKRQDFENAVREKLALIP